MGCGQTADIELIAEGLILDSGDHEVDTLRARPVASRRNLAGLRENGGDAPPLLFPEGAEDVALIEKAFDERVDVRLVEGGKPKCLELAELLKNDGRIRSRVLVDRDFDHLAGTPALNNTLVITTRAHDVLMDVLLAAPRILLAVIKGANKKRYRDLTAEEQSADIGTILDGVYGAVFNLACVRIFNAQSEVGLKFDNFSFSNYIAGGEVTIERAVDLVLLKSRDLDGLMVDTTAGVVEKGEDLIDVTSGVGAVATELRRNDLTLMGDHDFLSALNHHLDGSWGSEKLRTLLEAQAERAEILSSHWGHQVTDFVRNVPQLSSDLADLMDEIESSAVSDGAVKSETGD